MNWIRVWIVIALFLVSLGIFWAITGAETKGFVAIIGGAVINCIILLRQDKKIPPCN